VPKDDTHAFESIFEKMIMEVLNDAFTSKAMSKIDHQP
jgi:hypothetical protein